ncbi:ATP-binding protein [Secundilactobacillus malefermentans]|uniref:ATP-binding protein n=1 Tax=Secundilactobacillus malefermentans TaxID=176292 RepID=UPI0011C70352|nr:ATP-binding protein [Secundilactobacillus malefermentans]QEA32119.1 ATP-binding protein [Secundilactobacillus malefermentans]
MSVDLNSELTKIKNKKDKFQAIKQTKFIQTWEEHAPERAIQDVPKLSRKFQMIYDQLNSSEYQGSADEKRAWLDDALTNAVKVADQEKSLTTEYVFKVFSSWRNQKPLMTNSNEFCSNDYPKPTYEERHPLSDADIAINRMYEEQKKGRLTKVGSLVNYGGNRNYRFADFEAPDEATRDMLKKGKAISEDFKKEHFYNAVFSGKTGRGKTMLAVAIMNDLNTNANFTADSLIVSMAMFEDLLMATLDGERINERRTLEKRMMRADLLIWDDFGSDTSMKSDLREANDTTQKAIFRIADARQAKANIVTTNHTGDELGFMYNAKIISRLLSQNPDHIINFDKLPDRRMEHEANG